MILLQWALNMCSSGRPIDGEMSTLLFAEVRKPLWSALGSKSASLSPRSTIACGRGGRADDRVGGVIAAVVLGTFGVFGTLMVRILLWESCGVAGMLMQRVMACESWGVAGVVA